MRISDWSSDVCSSDLSHTASYAMNRTDDQGTNHSVNLSGAMLDDYSLTYALQAGVTRGAHNNGNTGYGAMGYSSPVGLATITHAYSRDSSHTSDERRVGTKLVGTCGVRRGTDK